MGEFVESNRRSLWMDKRSCKAYTNMVVAQSKEELREKVLQWKECMELKGLKVNIEKTKVMRSGKSGGEIVKTGR